jgi:hypothetical protein
MITLNPRAYRAAVFLLLASCGASDSKGTTTLADTADVFPGLDTMIPRTSAAALDTASWRIPDSAIVLAGLQVNWTRAQVIASLGMPDSSSTESAEMGAESVTFLDYPFGRVTLYDDALQYVNCDRGPCITSRGISPGDPRSKVVAIYGRGHPAFEPIQGDVLFYTGRVMDCGLRFAFAQDTVREIDLFCENS